MKYEVAVTAWGEADELIPRAGRRARTYAQYCAAEVRRLRGQGTSARVEFRAKGRDKIEVCRVLRSVEF